MNAVTPTRVSFLKEVFIYVGRMREFKKVDWIVYLLWVGLMAGLFFAVTAFVWAGWMTNAPLPVMVWNIPLGTAIFVIAIAIDTIGHRTIYRAELEKAEALVHHITIFAGISSVLILCAGYWWPDFCKIPAFCFIGLSVIYSIIDEAMHWRRYLIQQSDRVEMWSHFFIFVGHNIMIFSWWNWFTNGYPGAAETWIALLAGGHP